MVRTDDCEAALEERGCQRNFLIVAIHGCVCAIHCHYRVAYWRFIRIYGGSLHETFASLSHYGVLDIKDAQCFRVDATVETASWILVAAILVLGVLNHFIRAASRQKKQDDGIPDKTRRYADMLRQSKLASVSHNIARVASDEHKAVNDAGTCVPSISPIFTDFYFFETTHKTYVENVALGRAQI